MTLPLFTLSMLATVLALIVYHLISLRSYGRALAAGTLSASDRRYHLEGKRSKWMCTASLLVIAVTLLEGAIAQSPNARPYPSLFYFHLAAALGFLALFVTLPIVTGVLSPRLHRALGYSALVMFVVTLATGGILLSGLSFA